LQSRKKMTRKIKLNGVNKELELGKVNSVKKLHSEKEFIYLEKIDKGKDTGKWRLTFTEATVPEIKDLTSMEIIRED